MDRTYLNIFKNALSLNLKQLRKAQQEIEKEASLTRNQKDWAKELLNIIVEHKERCIQNDKAEDGDTNRDKENTC